jgi:hypothetical protein
MLNPNLRKTGIVSGYAAATSPTRDASVSATSPQASPGAGRRLIAIHKSTAQIAKPVTSIQALAAITG